MCELVQYDTEGPDISFTSVQVLQESFRRHTQWRSDFAIIELFPTIYNK